MALISPEHFFHWQTRPKNTAPIYWKRYTDSLRQRFYWRQHGPFNAFVEQMVRKDYNAELLTYYPSKDKYFECEMLYFEHPEDGIRLALEWS